MNRTHSLSLFAPRHRLMTLLGLVVLSVAAASAFAQPADAGAQHGAHRHAMAHHGEARGHGGHGGPGGGGAFGVLLNDRLLERAQVSPDQRAQIKRIVEAARADLRAQREGNAGLRAQALQVFTQPNVDATAAERVRQQMLAQHDRASQRMMQAMLEASRVLTPEQRAKMAEDLKRRRDLMERHHRERRALDGGKS